MVVFERDGRIVLARTSVRRSLKDPEISKGADLIGNPNAYHANSELISSFLFRFAKQFDLGSAVGFVRWMDQQNTGLTLALEGYLAELDENGFGPEYKKAWEKVVLRFFDFVKEWSLTLSDLKKREWLIENIREVTAHP